VSTRSAGGAPAGAISELGLPVRAVTALTRAGVTSTVDLAALTRRDLAAVPGLGAGMIAAIRAVVPEPGGDVRPVPEAGWAEQESPAAPAIPSFASLRAPQRRTAMDLLVPAPPPEPAPPPAEAAAPEAPAEPTAPRTPRSPGAPRPADYGDLLRIGSHLARAVAGVPVRAVRWSLCEPVRVLRRLLR
jgi:hypothetical protein